MLALTSTHRHTGLAMAYYISAICIPKNQKKKKLKNGFPWDAAVVGSIHEIKKKIIMWKKTTRDALSPFNFFLVNRTGREKSSLWRFRLSRVFNLSGQRRTANCDGKKQRQKAKGKNKPAPNAVVCVCAPLCCVAWRSAADSADSGTSACSAPLKHPAQMTPLCYRPWFLPVQLGAGGAGQSCFFLPWDAAAGTAASGSGFPLAIVVHNNVDWMWIANCQLPIANRRLPMWSVYVRLPGGQKEQSEYQLTTRTLFSSRSNLAFLLLFSSVSSFARFSCASCYCCCCSLASAATFCFGRFSPGFTNFPIGGSWCDGRGWAGEACSSQDVIFRRRLAL